MDKKTLGLILAIILIISFFLPYLSVNGETLSGFKMVFGNKGYFSNTKGSLAFLLLLIPLGAIFALFNSMSNTPKTIYNYLGLAGVLYLAIRLYIEANAIDMGVGQLISFLGYGFWISLVASAAIIINGARD